MGVTAWIAAFGAGAAFVEITGGMYYGFAPTFVGGIMGFIRNFFSGAFLFP